MRFLPILIMLLLVLSACGGGTFSQRLDYANGNKYYKAGNYKEAAKYWRRAAEDGYAWTQYLLGVMYQQGRGVPQDNDTALKWYRKAAEQGVGRAERAVTVMEAEAERKAARAAAEAERKAARAAAEAERKAAENAIRNPSRILSPTNFNLVGLFKGQIHFERKMQDVLVIEYGKNVSLKERTKIKFNLRCADGFGDVALALDGLIGSVEYGSVKWGEWWRLEGGMRIVVAENQQSQANRLVSVRPGTYSNCSVNSAKYIMPQR